MKKNKLQIEAIISFWYTFLPIYFDVYANIEWKVSTM